MECPITRPLSLTGNDWWLCSGKLSEEDVREMLANMRLAAPEDAALVKLLSKWAKRGRRTSPEPQVI